MLQATALTIMKTGANVFLTGEPGSGKTHTVNAYIRYLREHGVHPAITASTGIAATHVGGMTIHSWSGIGIRRTLTEYDLDAMSSNEGLVKRIASAKVLIIDEISMLDATVLAMVEEATRTIRRKEEPFGGLQVIFVGDFFQLPPIADRASGVRAQFSFESNAWRLANPITCYLSEQHRQEDTAFLSTLGAIRRGELEDSVYEYIGERNVLPGEHPLDIPQLYTHNIDVDKKNSEELAKLESKEEVFLMSTKGSSTRVEQLIKGCLSPQELILKEGASVMFTKNNFDNGYVNGTLGTIIGFDEDSGFPIVEVAGGEHITALPSEWAIDDSGKVLATISQVPLRLAWAITVHKSQGMSLDAATMDLSRAFEYGQGYVALSRVRAFSGLHILGINQRAFEVHPLVLERDQSFREHSDDAEAGFLEMPKADIQQLHENFLLSIGGSLVKKEIIKKSHFTAKTSTYDETLSLVTSGKNFKMVAKLRDMTEGTIVGHLEELSQTNKLPKLDMKAFTGLGEREVGEIEKAIASVTGGYLKPIYEKLKGKYSYEIIRLVRLSLGALPNRHEKEKKPKSEKPTKEKPVKLGAKWTRDEEERLVSMFQKGMKTKDIAAELKRLPGGIRSRLKKLGFIKK
ncbi:MAG: AAA ATPase [Parcubacteria group bacterium GW2011_GWA2_47_7]|nr:MAG: AAA ATPase [Parcubacteria group bacterium GW2011_GWA2_47_7]